VPPDGRFKLYFSPDGALQADSGTKVAGAAGHLDLDAVKAELPAEVASRFGYLGAGVSLAVRDADLAHLPGLLRSQVMLVRESEDGAVQAVTRLQVAGALDDLYAAAGRVSDLGVTVGRRRTVFKLWAPTARRVAVEVYAEGASKAGDRLPMHFDAATGVWSAAAPADLTGRSYTYGVEVFVPGLGVVENVVTDPYSISLTTDSRRSYIADLASAALKPRGWDRHPVPQGVKAQTDMTIYELHVRDFSINDATVPPNLRGKYGAFGQPQSHGMRHLRDLARAGLTDVHLLPAFDFGSVPEAGCVAPRPSGEPDGDAQQALVARTAAEDCFNWGYDPFHYGAPEGSYSTSAADGGRRIREFRDMVLNLHRAGLRVGMDVVYNHTLSSGQDEKSVLDRIVPGYYHRLDPAGAVERSTCCDNTATENRMMGKLMVDTAVSWVRHYQIDSFRFDLMGHQPRTAMEALSRKVDAVAGRHIHLIGEGWNFGEVADGKRFVQASQLSLNGSGIGTFSDRARDAVRGGSAFDSGKALIASQGYINGLVYDPNKLAGQRPAADLLRASDIVKLGLAGTVRTYPLTTHEGKTVDLEDLAYGGQPAGYASQPGEVVNYVENHDNQTLFDICAFRLPESTRTADRARVQMLGAAINMFSQGVAYFHAGIDTLRSKSLDRNSYDSGDWFNRLDWTYRDNYFGIGAPPARDNGKDYAFSKPVLANPAIKPDPADIAFARDVFRDLLRIRASSTLFRLRTARDIAQRLRFFNTGPMQIPTVIAAHLDGHNHPGASFDALVYFLNVDKIPHRLLAPASLRRSYRLHPVHRSPAAADTRATTATYDRRTGTFEVPARTAVVFVAQ
jgi:pullulanase/glycogen debranching enzyme